MWVSTHGNIMQVMAADELGSEEVVEKMVSRNYNVKRYT